MKKLLSVFITILVVISCVFPINAYASENTIEQIDFTQEEFESLEHTYANTVEPLSTGLIVSHSLGIAKDGKDLLISGVTSCTSKVVNCGFSKVIVQRKKSTDTSWSNYQTFNNLCRDGSYYRLSKRVTVESGYQYRVTATHYAKKSLLQTQKIDSTTGSLSF